MKEEAKTTENGKNPANQKRKKRKKKKENLVPSNKV